MFDPEQALVEQEKELTEALSHALVEIRSATARCVMRWFPDPEIPETYHGLLAAEPHAGVLAKLITVSPTCLWIFTKEDVSPETTDAVNLIPEAIADTWNEVMHLVSEKGLEDKAARIISQLFPLAAEAAREHARRMTDTKRWLYSICEHAGRLVSGAEPDSDEETTVQDLTDDEAAEKAPCTASKEEFDKQVDEQVAELEEQAATELPAGPEPPTPPDSGQRVSSDLDTLPGTPHLRVIPQSNPSPEESGQQGQSRKLSKSRRPKIRKRIKRRQAATESQAQATESQAQAEELQARAEVSQAQAAHVSDTLPPG